MSIHLSPAAANHIIQSLQKRGTGIGLRLGIKISGCSGFGYTMDYAEAINPEDHVFEEHGAKVVVDPKSLALIDGTAIDYQAEGLNWRFVFHNPHAVDECGCGESFSINKEV